MSGTRVKVDIQIDARPMRASLVHFSVSMASIGVSCGTCREYLRQRHRAIARHLVDQPPPGKLHDALDRLVAGVHQRHVDALAVLP